MRIIVHISEMNNTISREQSSNEFTDIFFQVPQPQIKYISKYIAYTIINISLNITQL